MILVVAALLTVVTLGLTLFIRPQDLPQPEPVSPVFHLEERKARIYENLRDLQFEYRLGKLSDADYQRTKSTLQTELSATLAEIDQILQRTPAPALSKPKLDGKTCPHCNAKFPKPMKFCGECGKVIA